MSKVSSDALVILHALHNMMRRRDKLNRDIGETRSDLDRNHDLDVADHQSDEVQQIRADRDWLAGCLKRAEASIVELQQKVREADTLRWQLEERLRTLEAQQPPIELAESEKELIRKGHLIHAIKELHIRANCGLRRAKDICDAWRAANK